MDRWIGSTACAITLTLSACGGGGGVGSTPTPAPTLTVAPTPPPPPPPPPTTTLNFDTPEYQRSNGAVSSKAISAWQAGATGTGVKLAVIDSGINPALAEFAGRIDPASRDVAGNRGLSDEDGHGTAVTATAAGARNDLQNVGIAFNSTIVSLRADSPGSCADKSTDKGCQFSDEAIAAGVDAARLAGAKVINMSLGGDPAGGVLLSAIGRAVSAGIVIVISAGNDGADIVKSVNADPFALSAAQAYPGRVIIAGALDTDLLQLASFSNRAGAGAAYYLTALGRSIRTIDHTGTGYLYSGTSFSAPIITGAVTLLAQAFPNLTGEQIIRILFQSADDLGSLGNDTTYGYGRLNIQRAFQPIGTTTLAGSKESVTTASIGGALPEAAGDAKVGAQSVGAVILDGYSRAFAIDLAKSLDAASARRPLERALSGHVRNTSVVTGPLAVSLSVASRNSRPFLDLSRVNIGPEDARQARLVAGNAVARLDAKTRLAFGISESAKSLERDLNGASPGAFLVARDTSSEPGFAVSRGQSIAVRRELSNTVGLTLSAETGKVDNDRPLSDLDRTYKLATVSFDRRLVDRIWISLGVTRLEERRSLLGGRLSEAIGGNHGASSWFVDGEARRDLGRGFSATLSARRGWTDFDNGSVTTSAYAFDLAKISVLSDHDSFSLRLSQPIRVEQGGLSSMLPTAYDYATGLATNSLQRLSLSPSGREFDAELSYGTKLGYGWIGANAYGRRNPGHIAGARIDIGAAIRTSFGF